MNRERSSGFVVSLVMLAILAGFFAIHQRFFLPTKAAHTVEVTQPKSSKPPADKIVQIGNPPAELAEQPHRPIRHVLQALGERIEDESDLPRAVTPSKEVPAPIENVPAETGPVNEKRVGEANTSAVREVIEHELSHATREERDIWFDELKSLPAGVVQDLLQVRKQLRTLPRILGGLPEKIASTDPATVTTPLEIPAEPASQKIRFHWSNHASSVAAIEMAISQLRHNLTNAHTPGYKRIRVTLVDAYNPGPSDSAADAQRDFSTSQEIQGEGCRVAPSILDLKQGSLKKTGRQFDLAIDGDGFFVVRTAEKEFLTRCGTLTVDRNRHLCLALADEYAILQPVISIPMEAREVQISADGIVSAVLSGGTPATTCGQLQLGRVACPARLRPMGQTLLITNEHTGNVVVGSAMANGFGEIHQGFIENSNVDFQSETDEIEDLNKLLKSLPLPSGRSATASSQPESHNR